jgi:hypothetical protein
LVCKTLLLGISCSTLNLIVVVVEASDVCASELCDLSSWSSNTASNIENSVSILDTNLRGKIVFVTSNGLVERFTVGETAEMEGLAPAVFVEICSKVVVALSN